MKDKNLTVEISNDVLSITIGVDILCHACEVGRSYGIQGIKITDKNVFVAGIALQLEREKEDGTTLIHEMFDEAVTSMLEDGEHGVDPVEDE